MNNTEKSGSAVDRVRADNVHIHYFAQIHLQTWRLSASSETGRMWIWCRESTEYRI